MQPLPGQPAAQQPAPTGQVGTGGIEVQRLDRIDPASIGTLAQQDGGFPLQMWQGASRSGLLHLLPQLPMLAPSQTMRGLARRLLLSSAVVPLASPADGGEGKPVDLLRLRVERLAAGGYYADAATLIEQAPAGSVDPAVGRVRLDALLLQGSINAACRLTRNYLEDSERAVWQKATAFCLAVQGQSEQAELYEQLLYENEVNDPAFFTLLDHLIGRGGGALDSLKQPDPLHLAMLRAAKLALPDDAGGSDNPAILQAIATAPNATLDLRLDAAERAEAAGLMDPEGMRRIYASVPFSRQERADPADMVKTASGPRAAALLMQVAQIDGNAAGRARALGTALEKARERGRYGTVARVAEPLLLSLQPGKETQPFAAEIVRALLVAGDRDKALAWFESLVQPARDGEPNAASAMLTLLPLIYIGDGGDRMPVSAHALQGWWEGQVATGAAGRFRHAALFYGLLEAFDQPVPPALWDNLLADGNGQTATVRPAVLRGLSHAGNQGVGTTVLYALVALGPAGPGGAATDAVTAAVRALRQAGLTEEARAIALEALVGRGF